MSARFWVHQLQRINGKEPEGCEWFILENHHEFGIYYEAAIYFNCPDEETEEEDITLTYANKCEMLPEKWDEEAKKELRSLGHTMYQPGKVVKMKAA